MIIYVRLAKFIKQNFTLFPLCREIAHIYIYIYSPQKLTSAFGMPKLNAALITFYLCKKIIAEVRFIFIKWFDSLSEMPELRDRNIS